MAKMPTPRRERRSAIQPTMAISRKTRARSAGSVLTRKSVIALRHGAARLRQDADRQPLEDRQRRQRDHDRLQPPRPTSRPFSKARRGADQHDQRPTRRHVQHAAGQPDRGERVGQVDHAADRQIDAARQHDDGLADRGQRQRHRVVDSGGDLEIARQAMLLEPNIAAKPTMLSSRIEAARIRPMFWPMTCAARGRRGRVSCVLASSITEELRRHAFHASRRQRSPRRQRRRGELGGDAAAAQNQHAVAEMRQLLGVGGVEQDGFALGGEAHHELVDLVLGGDIDAARHVVEQQDAAIRPAASARPAPSAGCRRTARPPAAPRSASLIAEPCDDLPAHPPLRRAADHAEAGEPRQGSAGSGCRGPEAAAAGPRSCGPPAPARCRGWRGSRPPGWRCAPACRRRRIVPRCSGGAPKRPRNSSRWPWPASPPMPRISPATSEKRSARAAVDGGVASSASAGSPRRAGTAAAGG